MDKKNLLGLIEKYNLSGTIDSVKWVVNDKKLKVDFVSQDKSLVGKVLLEDFDFEDAEFGVYTTAELIRMLSALNSDITIEPTKTADKYMNLKLSDGNFKMNYVLSDPAIIPPTPTLKGLPGFEIKMDISEKLIGNFLKAKGANPDVKAIAIQSQGDTVLFTVGHSNNNTNRIKFEIKAESTQDVSVTLFDIEQLKNILVANKDFKSGTIEISSKGLAKVMFATDSYKSAYYLVKLEDN